MIEEYLQNIVNNKQHNLSIAERLFLYNTKQYDKLLDAYSLLIRKFAHSYAEIANHDVDDIYQEGLLAAWRAINKFNPEVSSFMPAYIARAVRNAMVTYTARDSELNKIKVELKDEYHFLETENKDYEELHFVISKLKDRDKEILERLYFQDIQQKQIANELNLTQQAICMRHLAAIKRVKKIIKQYDLDLKL